MVCPAAETSCGFSSSIWAFKSRSFVLTLRILWGNASEADDRFIGRAALGDLQMSS